MTLASFRGQLDEAGIIVAVRDIADFYAFITKGRYLKNKLSGTETAKVFESKIDRNCND